MSSNKCRVCLDDVAMHFIFDESEDGIQSKFFQCFKEKIENIEGYPSSICDSCYDFINTTFNFITKYHASDKLLNTLIDQLTDVKKEVASDNSDDEIKHEEEMELPIIKEEPQTDLAEQSNDTPATNPLLNIIIEPATKEEGLIDVKEKLKNLKEINVKSTPKTHRDEKSRLDSINHCSKGSVKCPTKELRNKKPKAPTKKKKTVIPKPKEETLNEINLCDICGKTFNDKHLLKYHRTKTHYNTPRECPECHKVLNSDYYLKKHMNRIHGNKSFICDTCGKKYAFVGELNSHVKTMHLKLRPKSTKKFACEKTKCDRCFTTRKALLIHNRSVHTGERPSVCSECGASFYHDDYLKLHMRLHTGETPFKCPVCYRGYAQEGNMRSHMKYNHRLSELSPEELKVIKPGLLKCLK